MNIITGEKIQNLCDYYIGTLCDLNFNPVIRNQTSKHINLDNYDIEIIKKIKGKKYILLYSFNRWTNCKLQ